MDEREPDQAKGVAVQLPWWRRDEVRRKLKELARWWGIRAAIVVAARLFVKLCVYWPDKFQEICELLAEILKLGEKLPW